jgi:glycerol-3-phosphate dehydrogenase
MSDADVVVVGAGVVGSAVALALTQRGIAVVVLEAEREPGLAASGTNSGILHTGFDSAPGALETELILRSAALRGQVIESLGLPVVRCGALLRPLHDDQRGAVGELAVNAERNGVEASLRDEDGALAVPGEAVTDPIRFTRALAAAAERHGAELRTGARAAALTRSLDGLVVEDSGGRRVTGQVVVNCAGLYADEVARLGGDDSFSIYPRKGEFLVFDPPPGEPLDRILLPVPSEGTKGMLVFPTIDGQVIAGPTAVDGEDKSDWSVRPQARDEILRSVTPLWPPIEGAMQVGAYAGLRPAGRGVNYAIGRSDACEGLVNVAAIRSTGLTASLGIAELVCALVEQAGVPLGAKQPLRAGAAPEPAGPWWRCVAEHRAA